MSVDRTGVSEFLRRSCSFGNPRNRVSPRVRQKKEYLRVCVKNIFLSRDVCARVSRQIELKDHTPLLGKEGNVFQEPPLRHPLLPNPNRASSRSDSRNDRTESRKMLTYERDLVTLAMFFRALFIINTRVHNYIREIVTRTYIYISTSARQ